MGIVLLGMLVLVVVLVLVGAVVAIVVAAVRSAGPRICPICSVNVAGDTNAVTGHVLTHLHDAIPGDPTSGLRLACGCPNAVWAPGSNFPAEAKAHLELVHGMRR